MFHNISTQILDRMRVLEARDAQDRTDGTPRLQRLRQIPPETGRFLALLASGAPPGAIIEIGASAGYSTLWLGLAARQLDRRVTTFEILPEKASLALETYRLSGMENTIDLVYGDARTHLPDYGEIAFAFLDAEKEVYGECYEMIVPRLVKGGLLVADNAINFKEILAPMLDRALSDDRVDALVVPIGNGELLCRKI